MKRRARRRAEADVEFERLRGFGDRRKEVHSEAGITFKFSLDTLQTKYVKTTKIQMFY